MSTTSFSSSMTTSWKFAIVTVTTARSPFVPSPYCSDTPRTCSGASLRSFRAARFLGLIGRDAWTAFFAISSVSRAFFSLPLRKSAQYCVSVSRLIGNSSGNGTCRPSRVLKPIDGKRSLHTNGKDRETMKTRTKTKTDEGAT